MAVENLVSTLERAQSLLIAGERVVATSSPDDPDVWQLERLLQKLYRAMPTAQQMERYFFSISSDGIEAKLRLLHKIIEEIDAHQGKLAPEGRALAVSSRSLSDVNPTSLSSVKRT